MDEVKLRDLKPFDLFFSYDKIILKPFNVLNKYTLKYFLQFIDIYVYTLKKNR